MDSRNTMMLFLTSGIDINKVKVISKNNIYQNEWAKGMLTEDYEIASQIGKFYNFSVNKEAFPKNTRKLSVEEALNNSFYTKLGFHTPMYVESEYYTQPVYYFTGAGGENIRGYWHNLNPFGFANGAMKYKTVRYENSIIKILQNSFQTMSKLFDIDINDMPSIADRLYRETRTPFHFGRCIVENYLVNKFRLAPLMDYYLNKIQIFTKNNSDPHLLYALFLVRYQKDLLNFKVEGGRYYEKKTIELAQKISEMYPIKGKLAEKINRHFVSNNEIQFLDYPDKDKEMFSEGDEYWINITRTNEFKTEFLKHFPEEPYSRAQHLADTSRTYKLMMLYAIIAATKASMDVNISRYVSSGDSLENLFKFANDTRTKQKMDSQSNLIQSCLSYFQTAKIILYKENVNSADDISIRLSDTNCKVTPLPNNQRYLTGYIMESSAQGLTIKFSSKTEGRVNLILQSKELLGKKDERLPICIDYNYLSFDGNIVLEGRKFVARVDSNANIQLTVFPDKVYEIVIRWQVHGYTDEEFLSLVNGMIKGGFIYSSGA